VARIDEWQQKRRKVGSKMKRRMGRMGEKDAEESGLANALPERKSDTEPAGPGMADQSVQTKICPRWRGAGILLADCANCVFVGGMGGSGTLSAICRLRMLPCLHWDCRR